MNASLLEVGYSSRMDEHRSAREALNGWIWICRSVHGGTWCWHHSRILQVQYKVVMPKHGLA